jgi:hypothetical protein
MFDDDHTDDHSDFGQCFEHCCPRSATEKLIEALRAEHPEAETTIVTRPSTRQPPPAPIVHSRIPTGPKTKLINEVLDRSGVSRDELFGRSRHRIVTEVRQSAMFQLRELGYSYSSIGRFLNRDHTTILSGVRSYIMRHGTG